MPRDEVPASRPEGIRLQKFLAQAKVGSRRAAEAMIKEGRVEVNGRTALLGQRVDPARDRVEVDGSRVRADPSIRYVVINKPVGVITTAQDPHGRRTVLDLVPSKQRMFPIGRLDADTEGLLLLTNDGELAHRMSHPSFEVTKLYVAEVEGAADVATLRRTLTQGVKIDEGRKARATSVKVLNVRRGKRQRSVVEISLHEGRKHVVRKMLAASGHPVVRLVRTGIGPLKLGRLAPGRFRDLEPGEVRALYRAVGL